jgi:AraC family transcriptional regulator of adaptative response/methylated-DNA-[protein]-cysteine methyltransferase
MSTDELNRRAFLGGLAGAGGPKLAPRMTVPSHLADDDLYQALLRRDASLDGLVYVGVTSTRVFCRLTCPARKPRAEHCVFFLDSRDAQRAGFRPCLRCAPLEPVAPSQRLAAQLRHALDEEPPTSWHRSLDTIGVDPSTARRAFKRQFGITFLQAARAQRLSRAVTELASGGTVIQAQLAAGYSSGSGFREAYARVIGEPPIDSRGKPALSAAWIDTPLGPLLAVADDSALHLLEFADRTALPGELARLRSRTGRAMTFGRTEVIVAAEQELAAYFGGRRRSFDLLLGLHASAFERSVWAALCEIPVGTTSSYRELSRRIGHAGNERAVGRACGANQIAIVIPCHRVIASDGGLAGYGGKLWRKRWLLEHERRIAMAASTA